MLTLLKKLFGKAAPKAAAPAPNVPLAPSTPMPTIEVAHLSLAAITTRFTEELKPLLASEPEATVTVALPVPTILKQLPAGCVKMSLASLQRQAHGLIKPIPPGDKRMVDVPLAEIFRHVRPSSLRRRPDQRPMVIPETGYNLFGDAANPYAISPDDHLEQVQVVDLTPDVAETEQTPETAGPRVLKMDDGLREHFASTSATRSASTADSPASAKLELSESGPRAAAPLASFGTPKPATAAPIAKPEGPTLNLKVALLAANWPDDIRQALAALDPETVVTLPVEEVALGLSKGRVLFSWAQIRAWLEPASSTPTAAAENTALQLPLKIVAPAYLSASKKPKTERKSLAVDESIPALFSDGREPEPKPKPPAEPETPVVEAAAAAEPAMALAPETPAVPAEPASETSPQRVSETVGEIFGQPHKQDWTPSEIVAGTVKLPGVAGAIVALQEGLQVASVLPDGVKSEVVAAFLPQIFARLNQYSGEMKLGDVDDLLFTTHGAHCQIYRLGYVYLAVLGKPGESLPWHELRLISEELAKQTHK
jgi:predicted regulator of Ras-like GTPase activity (Roadblock/LC7/MglB family)